MTSHTYTLRPERGRGPQGKGDAHRGTPVRVTLPPTGVTILSLL